MMPVNQSSADGSPASAKNLPVSALQACDIPAVASMLARAFEVDAGYRALFPDAATRQAGLEDFFTRNLGIHLPKCCTRVSRDGAGPVATVTIRPPGGIRIPARTMLRRAIVPMALRHGPALVKRLLWLKRTYEGLEHELGRGRTYWHVHMMAVREDSQGRGLGSRLLRVALSQCEESDSSLPVVLTTHLEENVVFYRRAGFDVIAKRTLTPPSSLPYRCWLMRREA